MRSRLLSALLLLLALLAPAGPRAVAVEPDEILADAALEARARRLSAELRCLVCQNQSIDDSNAPLARDLRLLVRERLKTGASDEDVRAFIVARYGSYVLLKPPLMPGTLLLWIAPLIVLSGIGLLVAARLRQSGRAADAPTGARLTENEQRRLEAILERDEAKPAPGTRPG
jgi:cytochrome c-type biogenesis protein CcmH